MPTPTPQPGISSPTPPLTPLRNLSALWAAGWGVVRARGWAILATAFLIWSVFAAALFFVTQNSLDMAEATRLYEALTNPQSVLDTAAAQQAFDDFTAGTWLTHGWAGLGTGLALLALLYLLCAATANIAVTDLAYVWLTEQRKLRLTSAILRGVRRSIPGTIILGVYITVILIFTVGGAILGGYGLYLLATTLASTASIAVHVAAGAVGAFLGLAGGAVLSIWVYTVWSVSAYAVALSPQPWSALKQSSALTKGHRLDVLIRIILVLLIVGVLTTVLALPFDALLGVTPFVVGGIAPFAIALYLRVAVSAVSPLVSTTSLLSVYLDLGGATPASSRDDERPDT